VRHDAIESTDAVEARLRFDRLANELLDRIMPIPLLAVGLSAALTGRHPFAIGLVFIVATFAHLKLSQVLYREIETRGPRLNWLPSVRSVLAYVQTIGVYLLAGPEANAWYVAGPIVIAFAFLHSREGFYHIVGTILLMAGAGAWMQLSPLVIGSVVVGLATSGLLCRPIISTLRERDCSLFSTARAAEQAANEKSRFLAMMSHEIRTPLNGMLGLIDLLRQSPLSEHQLTLSEHLRESSQLLHAIVNDILDYSKIEAGKLRLEARPFRLRELGARCIAMMRPLADEKGLSLTFEHSDDLPDWVLGDERRIEQVVLNLLSNAIKFTSEGRVGLEFCQQEQTLELRVSDTGVGIACDQQARLFSPFEQADSSTSRRFGGTGLGLSICARLAEMMHGSIQVRSAPGTGTEFQVRLRVPSCDPCESGEAMAMGASTSFCGHVLVAEDNSVNQLVIEAMLERRGLSVRIVENGKDAVDAVMSEEFDLVLMDFHMPELDGVGATLAIRELEPGTTRTLPDVPIVALTADTSTDARSRIARSGMDAVLFKPVDVSELDRVLARWLGAPRTSPLARTASRGG